MDTNNHKNRIAEITDFTVSGEGIAHVDGRAVFIPGTVPGDIVSFSRINQFKNYAAAEDVHIVSPSDIRISPDCPVFGECGGCVFRHITYRSELDYKQKTVVDAFERIGKISPTLEPIVGCDTPLRYRNKAQLPLAKASGRTVTGFYSRKSHNVIPCDDCLLEPEEFSVISRIFCSFADSKGLSRYNEKTGKGLLRHLYIRKAPLTGEILVCPVINGDTLPFEEELVQTLTSALPQIKSIYINSNKQRTNVILGKHSRLIYGSNAITDILCGLKFLISPVSFYQVNSPQAERLYNKALEYAKPENKIIIDMYCGIGTIGLSMADKADRVIGVEIVESAVKDATLNAKLNNISNARFICADASKAAQQLQDEGIAPNVVILDPPRKGCDEALFDTICDRMNPERIVYISCNPATLARDAARLKTKGYQVVSATPFDLFPRTPHVETVALFSRQKI